MLWTVLVLLLTVGILAVPMVLEVEGIWQQWELCGRLVLKLGPVPMLRIHAQAGLDPLVMRAAIRVAGTAARPLQKRKKKSPKGQRFLRVILRRMRCRSVKIAFDLGIGQDAAATALGYGTLRALSESLVLWAQQRGAKETEAKVHAHFNEARYEGKIRGIFQTTAAHIIFITVKQWRKR